MTLTTLRGMTPQEVVKDSSKELFDLVRLRAAGSLYFFGKAIVGHVDLEKRCHLAACLFLQDFERPSKLYEDPRRHLKSSISTIAYPLWIPCRRVVLGQDPKDRIAIVSSTKTNAQRFLRAVKSVVESNPVFQAFFPELIPTFGNDDVWNSEEIIFPRKSSTPDPSIDTLGTGGKATSRHYDIVIEDDLINEENYDSPGAVEKAIESHKLNKNLLETPKDLHHVVENSWAPYDLNRHIVDNEPQVSVFSRSTYGWNPQRSRHLSPRVQALLEAHLPGSPIWPERFNKDDLAKLLQELGPRIFSAQYLNAPSDPDVVDFKEEHLRYFEFNGKGDLRILARRGVELEIVPRSSLSVCGAWDPALEAKSSACRSAVVIVGVDPKDRVFLLEVYARRREPLVMIDDVLRLAKKWQPDLGFAIEQVLFQKVLIDLVRRRAPRYGFSESLFRGVKPLIGKTKDARIRTLIGAAFAEGRVYIQSVQTDFIEEYIQFPIGKTKDILDAFAYSALLWRRGETEAQVEERIEHERDRLALRDPITGY